MIYNMSGAELGGVYDINGNEIATGGDSETIIISDSNCGWVTEPHYKTVDNTPYRLVWRDEFDGADLNNSFWRDTMLVSVVENRYQAWCDYYLSDSKLHLRIKRDAPNRFLQNVQNDVAESIIQSGEVNRLHTRSPFYHDINPFWGLITQEGYYECRFKVWKATGGCHTSWWCVGIQDGLNANKSMVEIDITEILGSGTTTLPHGQHQNNDSDVSELYRRTSVNVDFATDFHTVGFLWEQGVMKWWVDGNLVDTMELTTANYPVMHFLAAYKRRSGSGWTGEADTTLGDVEFQVDYLRIYKKATSQATNTVTIDSITPININANTENMTIDSERGCPICFKSYCYVNWSDGSRTEHWVKWDAVKETYSNYMTNQTSFNWHGYVYGLGIDVNARVQY